MERNGRARLGVRLQLEPAKRRAPGAGEPLRLEGVRIPVAQGAIRGLRAAPARHLGGFGVSSAAGSLRLPDTPAGGVRAAVLLGPALDILQAVWSP